MKEYTALQQAPVDETKEARQVRMKRIGDLIARFREMRGAQAAAAQVPASKYHGYVWVYLRQGGVARNE